MTFAPRICGRRASASAGRASAPPPPPAPTPAPVQPPEPPPVTPRRRRPRIRTDEIHFEPGLGAPHHNAKAILNDVALRMKQEPRRPAIVIGYTDDREAPDRAPISIVAG